MSVLPVAAEDVALVRALDDDGTGAPTVPVSRFYITAFAVAQVGVFTSFIPLLAILLPLKAEAIDPAHKAAVLSMAAFWGSVVAMVANPLAGIVSDRTTWAMGRRRPWMLVGAVGTVIAYWVIESATSAMMLVIGFMLFQLLFNTLFSPLNALVPDRIPDKQKGSVSGLLGLGTPIGGAVGALLIGQWIGGEAARYAAIAAILLLAVVPFALYTPDRRLPMSRRPPVALGALLRGFWIDPRRYPDFAWTWGARFLLLTGYTIITNYMLYYLQDAVHYAALFPGYRAEEGIATLTVIGSIVSMVSTIGGGFVSDRIGRRKPFVIGAAVVVAVAIAIFALLPTWHGMIAGYVVFGFGMGCFFAVDIALIAQVLPSAENVGKDLGIVNLTITFAQALAPIIAVQALAIGGGDYKLLFGLAAVFALGGAAAVQPVRGVR